MKHNTNKQKYITCIGMNFIEPIINLYDIANSFKYSGKNKIQVSPRENGFAVSIVTLSVLLVESILNRIKYLIPSQEPNNIKFFRTNFPKQKLLCVKIEEMYVSRDIIAHNHIWDISFTYNKNYEEKTFNVHV